MPEVIGAIRDKWLALGGEGVFGPALDGERPTFDGVGRAQSFQAGGVISWHPSLGAFAVWGAIGQKWLSLGRECYGYPITDEHACPDSRGRFNHFRTLQLPDGPEASIYWTPTTGAREVHGLIRSVWRRTDSERGPLGYPTSDEMGTELVHRSNFEHGFIDWNSSTGEAQVHGPVLID